jgi:hypothetical protein
VTSAASETSAAAIQHGTPSSRVFRWDMVRL